MNLLALELSGPAPSLALGTPESVTEREFSGERGRALLVEIDAMLRAAGMSRRDLSGVVAGTGPGSYTGLRIACAAARVLGFALGIPSAGLCSFQAAALDAPPDAVVHVLLDAYRGEVYHAAYQRSGAQAQALIEPRILPRDAVAAAVPDGAYLIGDPALCRADGWVPRLLAPEVRPRARQLLQLALRAPLAQLGPAMPLYLRAALQRPPPA